MDFGMLTEPMNNKLGRLKKKKKKFRKSGEQNQKQIIAEEIWRFSKFSAE